MNEQERKTERGGWHSTRNRQKQKRLVSESKRAVTKDPGEKWNITFRVNRKSFWKEVKKTRGENGKMCMSVKTERGNITVSEKELRKRWNIFKVC